MSSTTLLPFQGFTTQPFPSTQEYSTASGTPLFSDQKDTSVGSFLIKTQYSSTQPKLHKIDVVLFYANTKEREKIQDITVLLSDNAEFSLNEVLAKIQALGFTLEGHMISYFGVLSDLYVYCGNFPLTKLVSVPLMELGSDRQLTLKLRQVNRNVFDQFNGVDPLVRSTSEDFKLMECEASPLAFRVNPVFSTSNCANSSMLVINNCRRTKERKIGHIIEKVSMWRKLYYGVPDASGQLVRMSLEEAAQKVGISKKSLDDYLLQIRFGRKYGFNFNEHIHDKVGVLRSFVKKCKNIKKNGDMISGGSGIFTEYPILFKTEPQERFGLSNTHDNYQ